MGDEKVYFTPVERGTPDSQVGAKGGAIDIKIPLSYRPPEHWGQFFTHAKGWTTAFDPPMVRGASVEGSVRDVEQISPFLDDVDQRIEKANADYESQVVPRLQAQDQRQRSEAEDFDRRQEAARRAIEEHDTDR